MNSDTAQYITDMRPGRGIAHGVDRAGSIDGKVENRGEAQSNTEVPEENGKFVADSSETILVVMFGSTMIVKAAVACICQEDLKHRKL